jgi:hypothetical protein
MIGEDNPLPKFANLSPETIPPIIGKLSSTETQSVPWRSMQDNVLRVSTERPMVTPQLQRVLEGLQRVRRNGSGWIARCPAHEDRSPSLSIREDNDRILLHCFAGCPVGAVCSALELSLKDLFTKPRRTAAFEPFVVRQAKKQISSLSSNLTPSDRERDVTVVLANRKNPNPAFARALALSVEGELVQVLFKEEQ